MGRIFCNAQVSRSLEEYSQYFFFVFSKAEWKPVGCFKNSDRALDVVLERVGSKKSISARYAACTSAANSADVALFGMDDRRCWTGENAESTFSQYGTSGQCKTKNGLGSGLSESETMFVYEKDADGKKTFFCTPFCFLVKRKLGNDVLMRAIKQ